jgi:hypothetical protein
VLSSQRFDLFLQSKLLSLQGRDIDRIRSRGAFFALDHHIEVTVTGAQFADAGFNRQGAAPCSTP